MDIGVELSLYPFTAQYIPVIKEFIDRLNRHAALRIVTNSLSTQVFGTHEAVFDVLREEIGRTFAAGEQQGEKAVFVMKVMGPLAAATARAAAGPVAAGPAVAK